MPYLVHTNDERNTVNFGPNDLSVTGIGTAAGGIVNIENDTTNEWVTNLSANEARDLAHSLIDAADYADEQALVRFGVGA